MSSGRRGRYRYDPYAPRHHDSDNYHQRGRRDLHNHHNNIERDIPKGPAYWERDRQDYDRDGDRSISPPPASNRDPWWDERDSHYEKGRRASTSTNLSDYPSTATTYDPPPPPSSHRDSNSLYKNLHWNRPSASDAIHPERAAVIDMNQTPSKTPPMAFHGVPIPTSAEIVNSGNKRKRNDGDQPERRPSATSRLRRDSTSSSARPLPIKVPRIDNARSPSSDTHSGRSTPLITVDTELNRTANTNTSRVSQISTPTSTTSFVPRKDSTTSLGVSEQSDALSTLTRELNRFAVTAGENASLSTEENAVAAKLARLEMDHEKWLSRHQAKDFPTLVEAQEREIANYRSVMLKLKDKRQNRAKGQAKLFQDMASVMLSAVNQQSQPEEQFSINQRLDAMVVDVAKTTSDLKDLRGESFTKTESDTVQSGFNEKIASKDTDVTRRFGELQSQVEEMKEALSATTKATQSTTATEEMQKSVSENSKQIQESLSAAKEMQESLTNTIQEIKDSHSATAEEMHDNFSDIRAVQSNHLAISQESQEALRNHYEALLERFNTLNHEVIVGSKDNPSLLTLLEDQQKMIDLLQEQREDMSYNQNHTPEVARSVSGNESNTYSTRIKYLEKEISDAKRDAKEKDQLVEEEMERLENMIKESSDQIHKDLEGLHKPSTPEPVKDEKPDPWPVLNDHDTRLNAYALTLESVKDGFERMNSTEVVKQMVYHLQTTYPGPIAEIAVLKDEIKMIQFHINKLYHVQHQQQQQLLQQQQLQQQQAQPPPAVLDKSDKRTEAESLASMKKLFDEETEKLRSDQKTKHRDIVKKVDLLLLRIDNATSIEMSTNAKLNKFRTDLAEAQEAIKELEKQLTDYTQETDGNLVGLRQRAGLEQAPPMLGENRRPSEDNVSSSSLNERVMSPLNGAQRTYLTKKKPGSGDVPR
ncbi:hypothetical protein MMC25_000675 [Agyrium rufum]|nr:hypothetical protein [Agyrium rufum]